MRETKAAYDTLSETTAEMENIHFEKKQLAQQWKARCFPSVTCPPPPASALRSFGSTWRVQRDSAASSADARCPLLSAACLRWRSATRRWRRRRLRCSSSMSRRSTSTPRRRHAAALSLCCPAVPCAPSYCLRRAAASSPHAIVSPNGWPQSPTDKHRLPYALPHRPCARRQHRRTLTPNCAWAC